MEPDGWETLDLEGLDVENVVQRFERLRMADLKPDTLAVYGRRFRAALTAYREFLSSPATWQYPSGRVDHASGERKSAKRAAVVARKEG